MKWTSLNALVVTLCVFRLVRLIGVDEITARFRKPLIRRHGRWVLFLACSWCLSIWVAAGVVALTHFEWPTVRWGCYVLAASAVAGLLSDRS